MSAAFQSQPAFWKDKSVVVTGGAGFLGRFVVDTLKARGCSKIFVPRQAQYDLTNVDAIRRLYAASKPDMVIHLAAVCGGIGANRAHPAEFYYKNIMMGTQLMHEAYLLKVKKFVSIGTICAYPKFTPVPFREEDLWNGYPEETNAPYGLAKKMLLVQSQAYRQQYGFNSIYLLPVNLYGPGDNFDLESSHVIPALIRKFVEAKERNEKSVTSWGTGKPSREFLYVSDAADAIVRAAEFYNDSEPVNVGSSDEIQIRTLVETVKDLTQFDGEVIWDTTKPDGQPARRLETSKAQALFGFKSSTSLKAGLEKTIDWYTKQLSRASTATPS
jgi:GDP-L-fucose synthase